MYYMRMSILLVYPARVPAQKCARCDSAVTCVYVLACVFIDTYVRILIHGCETLGIAQHTARVLLFAVKEQTNPRPFL